MPLKVHASYLLMTFLYAHEINISVSDINGLKGFVCYIFASLLLGLNESTCQMKKNVFYFTSKPLFVLEKIKF